MIFKNSLNFIDSFFIFLKNKIHSLYLNSSIYNKKISSSSNSLLKYKPNPSLLDCLVKYDKKRNNIQNYFLNEVWDNHELKTKDYKNLNSFFWLFSLDLKSSKKNTQDIISLWIKKNYLYNAKSWAVDIVAKRIISWLSNSRLTYEDSDDNYKRKFNNIIKKQINHLISEIKATELVDDKIIVCSAVILTGLCYQDEDGYLDIGLNLLKKLAKLSFDNSGFPRSRNIRQLNFYLKYFVLIREWFKESQNEIPEFINENIYYLGQAYAITSQNNKYDLLFNGNHESNNLDFDNYLKRFGYNFKSQNTESGGYAVLNNKKICLVVDIGPTPDKKFSSNYQAGSLSFEIISGGKKLICNSGYFQNFKHRLNGISKSSATHSTLILDDRSSCKFTKTKQIFEGLKIIKKNIVFEKNYWKVNAAHDGYLKQYGVTHDREIEFYPEQMKFIGHDKIIFKNEARNLKYEIRFHLEPNVKVMKTLDSKTILIDLDGEGWKFHSNYNVIDIDNGLYFGKKNSFINNKNIFISGMTNDDNKTINWEITKL
jgi:uncharacterized heparinase superfamily protein